MKIFVQIVVVLLLVCQSAWSQDSENFFRTQARMRRALDEYREALQRSENAMEHLTYIKEQQLQATMAANTTFSLLQRAMQNGLVSYSEYQYQKYWEACNAYARELTVVNGYNIIGSTLYPVGPVFHGMSWYCTLQQGGNYSLYVIGDNVGARDLVVNVYDSEGYLVLSKSGYGVIKSFFSVVYSDKYSVHICSPDGTNVDRCTGTTMIIVGEF